PADRRLERVVQAEIEAEDGVARGVDGAREQRLEVRLLAEADDRDEVLLRVEHEAVGVDPAAQVDREVRHARDRAAQVDEVALDPALAADVDPAGHAEVAIEPGRVEHAAVDLDAELLVAA